MRLLVDTDMLIALSKADDSNHRKAVSLFKKHRKSSVFVTPFIIPEAATVLSYRVSQVAAKAFLKAIRLRHIEEVSYSAQLMSRADSVFLAEKSGAVSWIDCANVAAMLVESFDAIASFDKFYRKFGFPILN